MKKVAFLLGALLFVGWESPSYGNAGGGGGQASGSRGSGGGAPSGGPPVYSLYDQGMNATRSHNYPLALKLFTEALKQDPKNPDVLNMLAHSQRLTGDIDGAILNYWKALELRPHFPEAREYMGEAYIQAAQKQMEILKSYKEEGKEQLEDLTNAFKTAAKDLETDRN